LTEERRAGQPSGVGPRDALRVGVIIRAHGLTGAVEVRLDWPDSRSLLSAREVILAREDGQLDRLAVTGARPIPKGVLLSLAGVEDRNAAEECRGRVVSVPREALPDLGAGEYYLSDLVGATVLDAAGHELGRVVEVQMYPSVDAIVIDASGGRRWEQPLLDEWIAEVDVDGRRIVLVSEDGLIEVGGNSGRANDEPGAGARNG
jgi:16S rRNA processing protein RimM